MIFKSQRKDKFKLLLVCFFLVVTSSGCSKIPFIGEEPDKKEDINNTVDSENSQKKDAAHQISGSYQIISEKSLALELRKAKELYEKKFYTLASESFRKVRDSLFSSDSLHNNKSLPQFVQLKLADSLFFSQDYQTAILEYTQFLTEFSDSEDISYAFFQIGQSNQLLSPGVGRDNTYLEKSISAYEKVWKKYPNSPFSRQALERYLSCKETLQKHQNLITEYYAKITANNAFKARLKMDNLNKRELAHETKSARLVLSSAPSLKAAKEVHFKSKN
jgi:outer membrane protein assembly factor BamD